MSTACLLSHCLAHLFASLLLCLVLLLVVVTSIVNILLIQFDYIFVGWFDARKRKLRYDGLKMIGRRERADPLLNNQPSVSAMTRCGPAF
jgi:hypothetical protein